MDSRLVGEESWIELAANDRYRPEAETGYPSVLGSFSRLKAVIESK